MDQTEIELALGAEAGVIKELALRLHGRSAGAAEGREELAASVDAGVAALGFAEVGSDVDGYVGELLVASGSLVEGAHGGIIGLLAGDIGGLLVGERLDPVDLIAEGALLRAQVGDLGLHAVVLALQVVQRGQDVIELVEALQNLRAAIPALHDGFLQAGERRQNLADAAVADHFTLPVAHFQTDAPVHEPSFLGGVVDFRIPLAVGGGRDLLGRDAVLGQEGLNGIGALQRELFIVGGRANVVGVAGHFDPVILVLAEQVSQTEQARVAVRQNRGIELEVDFFPGFLVLAVEVRSLRKQSGRQHPDSANRN